MNRSYSIVAALTALLAVTGVILIAYKVDNGPNTLFVRRLTSVPRKQPNIIIIVADDYGFHDVGYHKSDIKTPNLDHLATTGVRLENYYVQQTCTPTRSQLLSGRYQIHTGLQHQIIGHAQPSGIPLEDPLIADKLKEAGYATHAVGKWHVGFYTKRHLPTSRGFDTFYGMLCGDGCHFHHTSCYWGKRKMCGYDLLNNTTPDLTANGTYSTHLFTNKAINIVENHDQARPLFLYLAYQAVHAPLQVPDQYLAEYKHVKDEKRKVYAAMVACMDEAIGKFVAATKRVGLWDNTVLLFTTDNGGDMRRGASNWPLRGNKGNLWEGGIRAVGFIHSNLLDPAARSTISRDLMHVTDWFPTLVKLAGGNLNGTRGLDGYDQWGTISTKAPSPRTEVLHNIDPWTIIPYDGYYNNTFNTSIKAALRVGDIKIVTGYDSKRGPKRPTSHHGNFFLFNITADPGEHQDLSASRPDLLKRMLDRLQEYQNTAVPVRFPANDVRADPRYHSGFWGPWQT